ncbi:purine-cytosine permease family protein [Blastococcus sp. SYSU D00820]
MAREDTAGAATGVPVEAHSIDYVPLAERHGKVWHQAPFWFMGNANLTTAFTGVIGPALGLGFLWTLVAIVVGTLFGTFFMAFHAVQGPRLGLPQMIQSRVQFGARGAIVPLVVVLFVYLGFSVFNTIIAADSLGQITAPHGSLYAGLILLACAVIAIVGYDLLHAVQRWLSILLVVNLAALTVAIVAEVPLAEALDVGSFSWIALLVQFGASAGYQMAFAPYVSDYTRYLPRDVPTRSVVGWTYLGVMASAIWLEGLGALVATAFPDLDAVTALYEHGNEFGLALGTISMALAVPAFIGVTAVALYGGMLTGLSILDCFRPVPPSRRLRAVGVLAVAAVAYLAILVLPEDYLSSFNNFLLLLLYFLVPWTAVNLVDFYFVRHSAYAIGEIMAPDGGVYGRWGGAGLISYFLGLLAMVPFFSTTLYTGPVAEALQGADISFLIGLPVAGACYFWLTKGQDRSAEQALVAEEERRGGPAPRSALQPTA